MGTIKNLIKEHRHNRWLRGVTNLWNEPVRNREEDILELKCLLIGAVITIAIPVIIVMTLNHCSSENPIGNILFYVLMSVLFLDLIGLLWVIYKAFVVLFKFVWDFIVFEQLSDNPLKFWEFDFLDLRSERKKKRKYFLEKKKLAETGSVEDMCELGRLFRDGEGCCKSKKKAHSWFDKAYKSGLPIAGVMDELMMKR